MQIKFKKLNKDAVIPSYAKEGDAGLDLVATSIEIDSGVVEYGTGLAVEIPNGYVGLIFPRSSIYKTSQKLSNSVGVIDSGYRGEIKLKFYTDTFWASAEKRYLIDDEGESYKIGDRIGQLLILPYPKIETIEVDELTETDRGQDGFGSTGR